MRIEKEELPLEILDSLFYLLASRKQAGPGQAREQPSGLSEAGGGLP